MPSAEGVFSYLGVAGTITTAIGLLSLIVLAAFGVARQHIKRNERVFRDAIATKNSAVVDAFLTRFDIPKDRLGEKAAYDLAIAQINAERLKVLLRYVLLFLSILAFFLLVFALVSPPPARSTSTSDTSIKVFLALAQVDDVESRVTLYRAYCSCNPDPEIIDRLQQLRFSKETPLRQQVLPAPVVTALTGARTAAEIANALAGVDIAACQGMPEFAVSGTRLACKNGKPVPFITTPNQGGRLTSLQAVIFHTSGTHSIRGIINVLTSPDRNVSAHLLISRTGAVVQFVDFDTKAFHAGNSRWTAPDGNTFTNLNGYSIGIMYDNVGEVQRSGGGDFSASGETIKATDVQCVAGGCWERFTDEQLRVTRGVLNALFSAYRKVPLLGHSDVSATKTDPGPAFPIGTLRREFGVTGASI
jgi:N-acetyl-anhydromuramyl-L-alanine amidase AmpD